MDPQKIHDIMSGQRRGPIDSLARAGLSLAASPYAAAMKLRRWAYGKSLLKSTAVDVPVICVGNVTTGGTGKTPMVAWLVEHLKAKGLSPAILTRGYKATDGASDEADLLAKLTSVPVVINPDRIAGARTAIEAGANVLVMDDGFQHRRLKRDLDIVLVDATNPFGFGHCLPRGLLREPLSALADAGAVVITRADRVDEQALQSIENKVVRFAPKAIICQAAHKAEAFIDSDGDTHSLDTLAGKDVFAFCGIANPKPFFAGLADLGVNVAGEYSLPDHVRYCPDLIAGLNKLARECSAGAIVTTQKDATKLFSSGFDLPLWKLSVRMQVTARSSELIDMIDASVSSIASEAQDR